MPRVTARKISDFHDAATTFSSFAGGGWTAPLSKVEHPAEAPIRQACPARGDDFGYSLANLAQSASCFAARSVSRQWW
jgi:hypothetical protein